MNKYIFYLLHKVFAVVSKAKLISEMWWNFEQFWIFYFFLLHLFFLEVHLVHKNIISKELDRTSF